MIKTPTDIVMIILALTCIGHVLNGLYFYFAPFPKWKERMQSFIRKWIG